MTSAAADWWPPSPTPTATSSGCFRTPDRGSHRETPPADGGHEFVGGVFLHVVPGPRDEDGLVVGKELLPASAFAVTKGEIGGGPNNECGAVTQYGQPLLDGSQER